MPGRDRVRLAVESGVLAVDVAEHRRIEQRVIERGVELYLLVLRAATDLYLRQHRPPRVVRLHRHRTEIPAGVLRGQVLHSVGDTHVADPDLHADLVGGRVPEADPGTGPGPADRTAAGHDRAAVPRAERGERAVELGHEEHRLRHLLGGAEPAAGHRTGHLVRADDVRLGGNVTVLRVAHLEQEVALLPGGKAEPADAG